MSFYYRRLLRKSDHRPRTSTQLPVFIKRQALVVVARHRPTTYMLKIPTPHDASIHKQFLGLLWINTDVIGSKSNMLPYKVGCSQQLQPGASLIGKEQLHPYYSVDCNYLSMRKLLQFSETVAICVDQKLFLWMQSFIHGLHSMLFYQMRSLAKLSKPSQQIHYQILL